MTPSRPALRLGVGLLCAVSGFFALQVDANEPDFTTFTAKSSGVALRTLSQYETDDPVLREAIDLTWERFLGNAEYYGKSGVTVDYIRMARWSVPHLALERQASVRSVLLNSVLSSEDDWINLKPADLYRLRILYADLGIPVDSWAQGVKTWFVKGTVWQSNDPALAVSAFNRLKEASKVIDMGEATQAWIVHMRSTLVSSPGWLAETEPNDFIKILYIAMPVEAPDEFKAALANDITVRFQDSQGDLNDLTPWRLKQLHDICAYVGISQKLWSQWVDEWARQTEIWQLGSPDDIVSALYRLRAAHAFSSMDEAYGRAIRGISQRSVSDPQWLNEADDEDLCKLVREIEPRLGYSARGDLALSVLNRLMRGADFDGELWYPKYIATLFSTPELRGGLRAELLDGSGAPRSNVGVVLTWAYQGTPQVDEWRAYLEQQIATMGRSGDKLALWQLLRAEASLPHLLPADPSETATEAWSSAAIAVAQSEQIRALALGWHVRHLIRQGKTEDAIASLRGQIRSFNDPEISAEVNAMLLQISAFTEKQRAASVE